MKFIAVMLLISVGHCLAESLAGDEQLVKKPSEAEIFGSLATDSDWTDVLYLCDFLKTFKFSCNVTLQGAEYLKNSSTKSPAKASGQKQPKFVIQNVTGTWSNEDGIMKPNYVQLDYLNIVAKCFFRTEYYECFGVPRCDGQGAMSACHGGEPWRGQYQGAPNIGFKANVTNMAMESPAMPQGPTNYSAENPNQPLIGASASSDGLDAVNYNNNVGGISGSGPRTLITVTNSSGTYTSTGGDNIEGSVALPVNGSMSIVRVQPTINENGARSGGVQVSSFASFSSGSADGPAITTNGGFSGFGMPSLDSVLRRRRPNFAAVSDRSNDSSDDYSLGSAAITNNRDSSNCSNRQNLRCLIQNFQKTIFQSLMSSFQFPNFQPVQPLRLNVDPVQPPFRFMPMQQQSQSMGPNFMSQSQGRSFSPRFGGFKILVVPDNTPVAAGPRSDSSFDDDDMASWLSSR